MQITIESAHALSVAVLKNHALTQDDADIVAEHLVDAHLCGHTFAGLPRLLVVLDRIQEQGAPASPVEVVRDTGLTALVDGHGHLGYVVCRRAIDIAIEKCRAQGIGLVGAFNSYYSGRCGYYTERAAKAGFVALHASSAFRMVAPQGGREPVLGSNPISFAFPADPDPVVVDISTAAITWGEMQLAERTHGQLPEGRALDAQGRPTVEPSAGLKGAVLPWGGHKGYALGTAIQLLGALAGGDGIPEAFGNFGFFFAAVDPDLFGTGEHFHKQMDKLLDGIHASVPAEGAQGAVAPGEGSAERRRQAIADGTIFVPDEVVVALRELANV